MKTIKIHRHPIGILSVVIAALFTHSAAAQYVTLTSGSAGILSSPTLTLASNDLATVVHLSTSSSLSVGLPAVVNSYLEVVSGGVTNTFATSDTVGGVDNGGTVTYMCFMVYKSYNLPIIAGPATLRVVSKFQGANALATIQVTKPASTFVPVNTVVIPNDSGASVQIIMESSSDMVSWTQASPGTYGTSASNRFFRVRAQR